MGSSQPAFPRPASTVAILRDGNDGVEVWLMRRHASMAFAAGMQAFPGGAVEKDDFAMPPWSGRWARAFSPAMGVADHVVGALMSAAVRETFEECGVLLVAGAGASDDHEAGRVALLDGEVGWPEFLARNDLAIDSGALVPWSRWITPEWSPRRFDAYFFVAPLPAGQEPRWIDDEADEAGWVGAAVAVEAHERGDLAMLPPTIATLRSIAKHATVADVLAAAPDRIATEAG